MKHIRQGSALILILVMMSILALVGLVINDMAWQLSTLARNRALHMQRYYMTRALLEFARTHQIEQETDILALPFAHESPAYAGRILVQSAHDQRKKVTALLLHNDVVVCSLWQEQ